MLKINNIRSQIPVLKQKVYGKTLVYLDNGATTQKPDSVINAISDYYSTQNSNIHRGVHYLSQLATDLYEGSRESVRLHLNANHRHEIIFTGGTTGSINLVAHGFRSLLKAKDEIIVSQMEHHSNIVPWQMACEATGAVLKVIPMNNLGVLDINAFENLITSKTKLEAIAHVSNALGTINPIKQIAEIAHKAGAAVLVDGAQAAPHLKIDVKELNADFYCISGHKMYGPTGIGVLYGKEEWLNKIPPYQGGGEMISTVTFKKTTYASLPHKLEAGTPNIAGAIGLKAAITWINNLGLGNISKHECNLLEYATKQLKTISGLNIIGESEHKTGVVSFLINNIHPYDIGVLLDKMGIAVRTGHHCAQPIMDRLSIPGTIRASFGVYNTKQEVDILISSIKKAKTLLS